jgi:hypothetical protein
MPNRTNGKELITAIGLRFTDVCNTIKCKRLVFMNRSGSDHYYNEVRSELFE